VMTPFPHTPVRADLEKQGRIFDNNWLHYTCDRAVFQPAKMSPQKLEELYDYAWETFYRDETLEVKMGKLYMDVISREVRDGSYQPMKREGGRAWRRVNECRE